jgi:hypothetical protein
LGIVNSQTRQRKSGDQAWGLWNIEVVALTHACTSPVDPFQAKQANKVWIQSAER